MTKNLSSMTKSNLRSLKTSCLKMNSMSYLSLRKSLSLKMSYLKMSLNLKKDLLYLVNGIFRPLRSAAERMGSFPMCSHPAASAARSCGNSARTISKSILWGRTVPIWSGPWPSSCRTASAPRPICKSRYKPHISLLIFLAECAIMESVGKPTQIT